MTSELLASDTTAIIVVDFQKDFMEGGALAVPGADYDAYKSAVVRFINQCRAKSNLKIVFSQDWHPAGHSSFASTHPGEKPFQEKTLTREVDGEQKEYQQMMWPDHCLQESTGAEFVEAPKLGEHVQKKGTRVAFDSYSAFMDAGGKETGLADHLHEKGVKTCVCLGLATDYCVYFTATDAIKCGFEAYIIPELCRGIDPSFDWTKFTLAGVTIWKVEDVIAAIA